MTENTAGPADLAIEQISTLLAPINANRVRELRGVAHLEAWDIRRWLNRVFGFGGWSTETTELVCISEREINKGRWTVVYRAQIRLTVKTTDGRVVSAWDDAAMGNSRNQPSLGDAHDMAMKTALSQALKRCAVNLGDAFGLSLYNGGSTAAVTRWSAAHPGTTDRGKSDKKHDEPVKPEPEPEVHDVPASPVRDFCREARDAVDASAVRQIWQDAKAFGMGPECLEQIANVGRQKAAAEPQPEPVEDQVSSHVHRYVWVDVPNSNLSGDFCEECGKPEPDPMEDEDHARAVVALKALAEERGINEADLEQQVYAALGAPIAAVSPKVIWDLINQLSSS